jgi:hypothetical protein
MKIQTADKAFWIWVKSNIKKRVFLLQGERAFSLPIVSINLCVSKAFAVKNKKRCQQFK